jgi:hypothetical protein
MYEPVQSCNLDSGTNTTLTLPALFVSCSSVQPAKAAPLCNPLNRAAISADT